VTLERRWLEIQGNLARTLATLAEREFLIIAHSPWNYYVQFSGEGRDGLWAEVSSNQYVHSKHKLTRAQTRKLLALGWKRPNAPPPELAKSPGKGSPNFHRAIKRPVDWAAVAGLTIETIQVLGVTDPGQWEYDCFTHDGQEIRFPQLGLRRRPPRRDPDGWQEVWSHPGALLISPAELPDHHARELLRLWIAGGGALFVTASPTPLGEPEQWGKLLFDLGRHIANTYHLDRRRSAKRSLERLLAGYHAAWHDWDERGGHEVVSAKRGTRP
jgi:hypothetical protein